MLALTPLELETAAERALFAELGAWDTGGSVRGAVVASLPVFEGPMRRRVADAVVFVPEGLAVVRVVEVVRQSGVVTASPEGAWTIGPGAGPGEVLRLAGGGSTPLDGLMRAGMDAAVRLRRAGLEPGRIARLSVLYGPLAGLLPADGDLGEGDQVALVEPRSLLTAIARAGRHAGTDNPRLWTTADVRAALEALGLQGRSPSVEELNGEGFPYSPYVLRRPDLLTPAAIAASSGASQPSAQPRPGTQAPGGPLVDPAAAGRLAAAAVQAQEVGEESASASAPSAVVARPESVQPAAPAWPAAGAPRPSDTVSLRTPEQAEAPQTRHETGGLGGLFGSPGSEQPAPATPTAAWAAAPPTEARPAWAGPAPTREPYTGEEPPADAGRRRTWVLLAAGLLLVLALAGGGWVLTRGGPESGGTDVAARTTAAPSTSAPVAEGLAVGDTQDVDGLVYTLQASQVDRSCLSHAYGEVQMFFTTGDCTGLSRALFSVEADGLPAVVSVSQVVMPDSVRAQALQELADSNGTGNVSDLLREGISYAGAPERLSDAAYDSRQRGATVTIVEASWAGAPGEDQVLEELAESGRGLALAEVD